MKKYKIQIRNQKNSQSCVLLNGSGQDPTFLNFFAISYKNIGWLPPWFQPPKLIQDFRTFTQSY
jgi:hypothetical protein